MKIPSQGTRYRFIFDQIYYAVVQTDQQVFDGLVSADKTASMKSVQTDLASLVARGLLEKTGDLYSVTNKAVALLDDDEPKEKYIGIPAAHPTRDVYAEPVKIHKHTQAMRENMVRR